MIRHNKIIEIRANDGLAYGISVQTESPDIVESIAAAGYDFIYIDCEHGSFDIVNLNHMLRAADAMRITALVRVPDQNPIFISRVLDAGAMGIIVPSIETAEQAKCVVSAARYKAPNNTGKRGACATIRSAWHLSDNWREFTIWSNKNILVWLIIESVKGIENASEICEVPGVDGIVLGAFDLAQELGYLGQPNHPDVTSLNDKLLSVACKHVVPIITGLMSATPEDLIKEKINLMKKGVKTFIAGNDRKLFRTALNIRIDALKKTQN
ncbi:HpcH/HpaI aldolase family protein [Pseudomonas azerbaijanoccidentalis]